jgi:hypothetical protein
MPVVVATRMKVRRLRDLPAFFLATLLTVRQARNTPGFCRGLLRIERGPTFWTLTVWESGRAMTTFRDTGAHERVAPSLAGWASEAVFGVWSTGSRSFPTWSEVSARVVAHPNLPTLDRPGPRQGDLAHMPTRRVGLTFQVP